MKNIVHDIVELVKYSLNLIGKLINVFKILFIVLLNHLNHTLQSIVNMFRTLQKC